MKLINCNNSVAFLAVYKCIKCYIYYSQSGEVSLHAAVHCGHVGVVKALLNKGASVDTKTKVGFCNL